jgi:hypothetical protein
MQSSEPIEPSVAARDDVVGGTSWAVLGLAILIASLRMDRLEAQGVNPYTAPGLVPGLLGIGFILFGGLMLVRGLRHGGLHRPAHVRQPRGGYARIGVVIALCIAYAAGLVGHGPPFWLASALFVSVSIGVLQFQQWRAEGRLARGLALAGVIGLAAGIAVTFVFERFFLVRLP